MTQRILKNNLLETMQVFLLMFPDYKTQRFKTDKNDNLI